MATEERIASAYADLTLLSESARLGMLADSNQTYEIQADSVLRQYGLTKEEFDAEFRRCADDPELAPLLFNLASKRIQTMRSQRDSSARQP